MKELVDAVYHALSQLPWSGSVAGFSEEESPIHLYKYTTTDWLTTIHENQMLNLLSYDIIDSDHSSTTIIQPTYFIPALLQAYHRKTNHRNGALYRQGQSLALGTQTCLATIMNYKGTHWVALVLDFCTHTIWHGDSLGWTMDIKLKTVLEWWTREHTSVPFMYKSLPIMHQDDAFSCGLLAWNALSHFFLPAIYPLINAMDTAAERLRVLLRVCERHQQQVSHLVKGLKNILIITIEHYR
jgi:hypothetical protein